MLNIDMSRWELDCQIQGNEIIVSMPDTGWTVTFYKSANSPQLLAKASEKERGGVMGEADFFARAWNLANDKAREDCLTQETRPRAEDASRVPRRADPVAECDLAEVSPRARYNPR
jgi:hypothetical protein